MEGTDLFGLTLGKTTGFCYPINYGFIKEIFKVFFTLQVE